MHSVATFEIVRNEAAAASRTAERSGLHVEALRRCCGRLRELVGRAFGVS
jgi:hypothetical protein